MSSQIIQNTAQTGRNIIASTKIKHRRMKIRLCSMSLEFSFEYGWRNLSASVYCVCIAESLHCSPETITTLLIGSTPIQNDMFNMKKKTRNQKTEHPCMIYSISSKLGYCGQNKGPKFGSVHLAGSKRRKRWDYQILEACYVMWPLPAVFCWSDFFSHLSDVVRSCFILCLTLGFRT